MDEIEDSHNNKKTYPDADHVEWLINRVKVLTEALEKIARVKTVGYTEARKARKTAQDALIEIAEIGLGSK
jgi:hypothetical protein